MIIFLGEGLIKETKSLGSSLQTELPFKPVFVDEGTSSEDLARSSGFFGTKSSPGLSVDQSPGKKKRKK